MKAGVIATLKKKLRVKTDNELAARPGMSLTSIQQQRGKGASRQLAELVAAKTKA
jgi:hypothetical protein